MKLSKRHVYLLDGALLLCSVDGKVQCKGMVPATSLFPADLPDTSAASNLMEWTTAAGKTVVMAAASHDDKYAWMQQIRCAIPFLHSAPEPTGTTSPPCPLYPFAQPPAGHAGYRAGPR